MLYSPVASSDLEGRILGGCRLLGRLSAGAMGDVYLAEQVSLGNRLVAVKVVPVREATDRDTPVPAAEARFMHEARVLAQFAHPNILTIHDSGVTDGLLYLVMPYVPDGSLGDIIRGKGHAHVSLPVTAVQAEATVRQIAAALQYTHDRGMVHRDVKPSNVLVQVQPDGSWHLLLADFGIARRMESTANPGSVSGTIAYMAPEQLAGKFSPASDQYALGVLSYLLLAGRTPFVGGAAEVMNAHGIAPVPEIQRFNPAVPEALSAVVVRALAKNPEDRWPSVTAFSQAMSRAVSAQAHASLTNPDTEDATVPIAAIAPVAFAAAGLAAPEPSASAGAMTVPDAAPLTPSGAPVSARPVAVSVGVSARERRHRRLLVVLGVGLLLAGLILLAQQGMRAGIWRTVPSRSTPTSQPTTAAPAATGNPGGSLAPGSGPATHPTAQPATPQPQTTRSVVAPTTAPTASPASTATPARSPTAQPSATPGSATPASTAPATTPGAQSTAPSSSTTSTDAARLVTSPSQVVTRSGKMVVLHVTITNTGSATWSGAAGYAIACDTASHPAGSCAGSQPMSLGGRTVAPGQSLSVTVKVSAPATSGTYRLWWNLTHNGVFFTTPDGYAQVTVTG